VTKGIYNNAVVELFPVMRISVFGFIPWDIVTPHEAQAKLNHSQSLETLASRGGLSPEELLAVLEDRPSLPRTGTTDEASMEAIRVLVAKESL